MSTDFEPLEPRPSRNRAPLILGVVAFLAGLLLAGLVLSRWEAGRTWLLGGSSATVAAAPDAPPVLAAGSNQMPADESRVAFDPGTAAVLDQRVGEIEARIDRVAERANAAGDNAARAEGLLVAFAARRAIDRGLGLGYIEGQLRQRFGASQPQAVATIIDASRDPITLDELQLGLDDLAPGLTSGSGTGWWPSLRNELSELVVVRRAGTPSPVPTERLRQARRQLQGGQVDKALVEVSRLPGSGKAGNWMAAARRYIQTRRALDVIETTAILTPSAPAMPPPLLPDPAPAM